MLIITQLFDIIYVTVGLVIYFVSGFLDFLVILLFNDLSLFQVDGTTSINEATSDLLDPSSRNHDDSSAMDLTDNTQTNKSPVQNKGKRSVWNSFVVIMFINM